MDDLDTRLQIEVATFAFVQLAGELATAVERGEGAWPKTQTLAELVLVQKREIEALRRRQMMEVAG